MRDTETDSGVRNGSVPAQAEAANRNGNGMRDWVLEAKHLNMPPRSMAAIRNWETRPMIGGIVYHFSLLSETLGITATESEGHKWQRG